MGWSSWKVLLSLSLRSLVSHRVKSLIVGLIMLFGTFLLVLGAAVVDGLERSMARSIVNSLAGHLQLYDADARDELALFGSGALGATDYGEIPDFAELKAVVEEVPNVKSVVPMGITLASTSALGELDRLLGQLRQAHRDGDQAAYEALIPDLRRVLEVLREERETLGRIETTGEENERVKALLDEALSETFTTKLKTSQTSALDFLDTRIAPLSPAGRLIYLRMFGTDMDLYPRSFDRFKVVDGDPIPPGKRGLLISKRIYERILKNKVAREFDSVHQSVTAQDLSIDDDSLLRDRIRRMVRLHVQLALELGPEERVVVEAALREVMPGFEGDFRALLAAFLDVSDENVAARYKVFYDVIAPRIDLYPIQVGDVITLRSFSRTGYIRAVNVKFYGTFTFEGLESSDLAGAMNITDMVTFRRLYGQFTAEQAAEMKALREEVGVKEIEREDAEAALFGGAREVEVADDNAGDFDEFAGVDLKRSQDEAVEESFEQADVERGLALNAAVILDDPARLVETQEAIGAALKAAGQRVQVVDWQQAAGLVGQFIVVVRLVLYVAIAIIFLVALVIINNSMLMATMERVGEIGTMRAIGAQRGFVLSMFLIETLALGVLSGGAGALVGAGLVTWLGQVGIPASNDALVVLFAGPRLYPQVALWHLGAAVVVILVVSLGSTLYPAWVATRVQPVEAMRGKE